MQKLGIFYRNLRPGAGSRLGPRLGSFLENNFTLKIFNSFTSHHSIKTQYYQTHPRSVSWVRLSDGHILTVARETFIRDPRFSSSASPPVWRLQVLPVLGLSLYARPSDSEHHAPGRRAIRVSGRGPHILNITGAGETISFVLAGGRGGGGGGGQQNLSVFLVTGSQKES